MSFNALRLGLRLWPLYLLIGILGLTFVKVVNPNGAQLIAGRLMNFYIWWAGLGLTLLAFASAVIMFACGPKRAIVTMALGGMLWYGALKLPMEPVPGGISSSALFSIFGAYILITGLLSSVVHALMPRSGPAGNAGVPTRAAFTSKTRGGGPGRELRGRDGAIAAGALAAAGIAAGSAVSDDEDDGFLHTFGAGLTAIDTLEGTPMGADHDSSSKHLFNDDFNSGPSFNIDGTPMLGDFDINGHAYGVTDDGFSGSNDSFGTDSFGNDSFGSGSFSHD